jgi:sporulation protein YabP
MYREGVHAMVDELYTAARHEVVLSGRNALDVSGVISLESFDSEEFLLNTECGYLGIRGQNLHIKSLDLEQGKVSIEGSFYEMSYLDDGTSRMDKTKGLLGRLFR